MTDKDRDKSGTELLAGLVERLRGNRDFMAHVLATYQQQKGLDDEALVRELNTPPEMIVRLALCKKPDVKAASFDDDLRDLSGYTLADEKLLSHLIRRSWSDDGCVIPMASPAEAEPAPVERLRQPWAVFAERLASPLATLCSLALLLIVGGVLLWRQAIHDSSNALATTGSETEQRSTDSQKTNLGDVAQNMVGPAAGRNSPGDRSRSSGSGSGLEIKQISINLDGRSELREAGDQASEREQIIKLSRSRFKLRLKLPQGSSPGEYSVSIVDAFGEPIWSGKSVSSQGRVLIALIDTTAIPPADYRLCVRRESKERELPEYVPLRILRSRTDADRPR